MNTYEVWVQKNNWDDEWCKRTYVARTASAARYQLWQYMQDGLWEEPYSEVFRSLRSRKIGGFKISDIFGDREKFNGIKERRKIPFAYLGMKIEVDGKMGRIVGGNDSGNLDVCFDGEYRGENCHPWWETRYFDSKGNVIKDYRESAKTSVS